jgi:hypothetical protein
VTVLENARPRPTGDFVDTEAAHITCKPRDVDQTETMNMKHADYILTTFSPAMFGEKASAHFKLISREDAAKMVGPNTEVIATRVSHDRLARKQLPGAREETGRYARLRERWPGKTAQWDKWIFCLTAANGAA